MCGRFTQKSERPDIQLEFYIRGWQADPDISFNIAPSQKAGVIINDGEKNIFTQFQWGLIPHWAKDPKMGYNMINAKAETVAEKPSFKYPFKKKRCLIPADGFFEWKKEGKIKIPYYIFVKDNPLCSFAGLYDEWGDSEKKVITFIIITTEANDLVSDIHDKKRMPVIIRKDDRDLWLDNNNYNEVSLLSLLKPYDSKEMNAYIVSDFVNAPRNNSPVCIEPVSNTV